jgi:long-chain acyl-CoA synthetase
MNKTTLAKLFTNSFHNSWNELAFTDYEGRNFKYSEVAKTIMSLQLFYQIMGLQKGDKIAVLGRNSANWGATFLSAVSSGLVIVPVLPDFNKADTNHIISHSEAKIVVGAKSLLDKVDIENLPLTQAVLVLEDFSLFKARDENVQFKINDSFQYYKKNELKKTGFAFQEWEPEDTCIISYTSGTSGFTKGVMIPERSLVSNIIFAREHMPLKTGDKIVSFLPMAHVYGLLFEFLFPLSVGCHITFLSKMPAPALLTKVFGEVKPHLVLSVPLIIEKIYKKRLLPTLEKPVVKILLHIPGISSILLKKIRSKLFETFGGRFFEIVIGGAPLNSDVEKFFKRINFPFSIGYGMTECGPLISYEAWDKTMQSSAGKLVDRMEVRIDSEDPYNVVGEIQVKGENVMIGYYKNEEATRESFTDDGWLKTGDLGIIDKNNFIYIKGRSKNMLLGPSGQNIYPEEIESKLTNQPFIAECVVTERKGKLIALIYPDLEALKTENIEESAIQRIMEENIKKTNHELPKYEQLAGIEIVNEEFEKTPKKNIKRFKYV